MNLTTAVRLGIAGTLVSMAAVPIEFAVAAVLGIRMGEIPIVYAPLDWLVANLGPIAILTFLLVLYLAATGRAQAGRLGDTALAACVVLLVVTAYYLRWSAVSSLFVQRPVGIGWVFQATWLLESILERAAWLGFLVTLVSGPQVPLKRWSRRAAGILAVVFLLECVLPAIELVWRFSQIYAWLSLTNEVLSLLSRGLLLIFAAALAIPKRPERSPETHSV